jgi:hypothetical protein
MTNKYKIAVEEHERKRPTGRPKSKFEDNITIYLREIWWEDMDWMHLAQDRDQWGTLVKTVKNLLVP